MCGLFRSQFRYLLAVLVLVLQGNYAGPALANVKGDVAPYGSPDGRLDTADLAVVVRFLNGAVTPTQAELQSCDVAPLDAPDGILDAGDLLLLERSVMGLLSLDPFSIISPPLLWGGPGSVNLSPYHISGLADPGQTIKVYRDGFYQGSVVADVNGLFGYDVQLLSGVLHLVTATAILGGQESNHSSALSVKRLAQAAVADLALIDIAYRNHRAEVKGMAGSVAANAMVIVHLTDGTAHIISSDSSGSFSATLSTDAQISSFVVDSGSGQPSEPVVVVAAGAVAGNFEVSPSGAATYRIPIAVPPGTAGLNPDLSLDYSSHAGNGIAGHGWSLGGLSAITRCPATIAQDGRLGGVNLDDNDRFCMDGQRLVAVNGVYGGDLTEYRTEIESFTRIISYNASSGLSPDSFRAWTRSGQIIEYGNTSDSAFNPDGGETLVWGVSRVEDRAGNYYTVTYHEDLHNNENYPLQLDYTANDAANLVPYNSIEFKYISSSGWSGYVGGRNIHKSQLLDHIIVRTGTRAVRDYRMSYQGGQASETPRLGSVTECDSDRPDAACMRPTTFGWSAGTLGFDAEYDSQIPLTNIAYAQTLDINGDGRQDLIYPDTGSNNWKIYLANDSGFDPGITLNLSTSGYQYAQTIDYNMDGFGDLLIPSADTGTWLVYQTDKTLFDSRGAPLVISPFRPLMVPIDSQIARTGYDKNPQIMDVNGDGLPDLVYVNNNTWNFRLLTTGYSPEITTAVVAGYFLAKNSFKATYQYVRQFDYDNDGKMDLLCTRPDVNVNWWIARSTGSSFDLVDTAVPYLNYGSNTLVLDANGDGLTDVMVPNYGWRLWNNKSGALASVINTGMANNDWSNARPADFNADGRLDVMLPTGANWGVYLSGNDNFTQLTTNVPVGSAPYAKIADFNGDGLLDFLIPVNGSWKLHYRSGEVGGQINTITNGMGIVTAIDYKPLTDDTVYTKYTNGSTVSALDFQGAMYVVSQTRIDDGIGGTYRTDYHYSGARIHQAGRGFLGFEQVTSSDPQSGIATTVIYRQNFPFVGMQAGSQSTLNGKIISTSTNTYAEMYMDLYGTVLYPYVSQSVETSYDLPSGGNQGALLSAMTTASTYDSYGNPLIIDVTTASAGGDTFSKHTTNIYDLPDLTNWVLDRVSHTTVVHRAPNTPDITRVSAFDYYPAGHPSAYLLKNEIIEPDAGDSSPLYQKTTHEYDAFGNKVRVTTTARAGYDANSPLESRSTETQYDSYGRFPEWTRNALNQTETYTYDARFGMQASLTGPNGLTTAWTYDSFGRKVLEKRADGTETRWQYDFCPGLDCPNGGYIETTSASGSAAVKLYHDALQHEIRSETVSMLGDTIRKETEYDARGNIARKSRPYLVSTGSPQWTDFSYDELNRPMLESAPDGGQVSYVYDNLARKTRRWHMNGDYDQTDIRVNDVMEQLSSSIDTLGGIQSYSYDAAGNLVSSADSAGNTILTGYDLRGRKVSMDDPDMGHWEYKYNGFGELVWQKDAKNQVVTMGYDKLGRMISRTEPEGVTVWVYDSAAHGIGKLASVSYTGSGHGMTYQYDALGRVASQTSRLDGRTMTMAWSYDGFSRAQTIAYPTGFLVRNIYDDNGFLAEVRDATKSANDEYFWHADGDDAEGRVTLETLGNHLETIRQYDAANGTLQRISTGFGGGSGLQSLSYKFDSLGNLTQRTDTHGGYTYQEDFSYDDLNRLESSTIAGLGTLNYVYDVLGNIRSKPDYGSSYEYLNSKPHAVSAVKNGTTTIASYSYDANGNMTGGDGRSITWTSYNKASQITKGAAHVSFAYGADHNRVKQVNGNTTTYYLNPSIHAGVNYEEEITGNITAYKHYVHAGGRVVAIYTRKSDNTEKTRYLHTDHLGSTDVVTDETGNEVERMSFAAFGSRRNLDWSDATSVLAGLETHHGFTGHEQLDTVGIIHMNGRLYDPKLGRFLSPDPTIQYPDQTQSFNRYTYVNNNPLSMTDPSGYGFFSKLWKSVKSIFKNPRALLAVVAGFATGFAVWAALGYGGGFVWGGTAVISGLSAASGAIVSTLIMTRGDLRAALKAGLISGLTAFAGVQIKQGIKDYLHGKGQLYNVEPAKGGSGYTLTPANAASVTDRLFVNGILNDLKTAVGYGLKQFKNESFTLYHNPSHGFIADLTEATLGKLFGNSSISNDLASILQANPGLSVIAHSQGGIIAVNAIEHLAGSSLPNLSLTLNGSATAEWVARAALDGVGSKLLTFNSHPLDLVSNVVALDTLNPFRIVGSIVSTPFLFTADSPHVAY